MRVLRKIQNGMDRAWMLLNTKKWNDLFSFLFFLLVLLFLCLEGLLIHQWWMRTVWRGCTFPCTSKCISEHFLSNFLASYWDMKTDFLKFRVPLTCVFWNQTSVRYKNPCNRTQLMLLPSKTQNEGLYEMCFSGHSPWGSFLPRLLSSLEGKKQRTWEEETNQIHHKQLNLANKEKQDETCDKICMH